MPSYDLDHLRNVWLFVNIANGLKGKDHLPCGLRQHVYLSALREGYDMDGFTFDGHEAETANA